MTRNVSDRAEAIDELTTADLLAAILMGGSGYGPRARLAVGRQAQARDVAVDLLADLGGEGGAARATVGELAAYLGVHGPRLAASARALACAFELGRRMAREPEPAAITSSGDVARWAIPRLARLDHEELWLLALDGRSRVRAVRRVGQGGLHGMGVRCADPLRFALRAGAAGFVLVHNHPSGDPTPSAEDVAFTARVAAAGAVADVPLLDHVVVATSGFASVPMPAAPSTRDGMVA
ncbi:MAG: repair protein RadC [Labilithrix sp.]|nr:repair protein RadC [Labilithrix sp.]